MCKSALCCVEAVCGVSDIYVCRERAGFFLLAHGRGCLLGEVVSYVDSQIIGGKRRTVFWGVFGCVPCFFFDLCGV